MNLVWRKPPDNIGEQTRRKVAFHLIPYLFFLYILAYLDRTNVAVAQFGMNQWPEQGGLNEGGSVGGMAGGGLADFGGAFDTFGPLTIGWGMGMFFWGYWCLEIPSTVSVLKWGAKWVFMRILVLWGLSCFLIGFIGTPWLDFLLGWLDSPFGDGMFAIFEWLNRNILFQNKPLPLGSLAVREFYFLRFLLGFFEGGFFPSVIVYLSLWFRPQDRAKAIASFMIAIPFSSIIGLPLSSALSHLDLFGLVGWRWIFLVQGFVPVLAGFATYFFLPNGPNHAKWLTGEEKTWLNGELEKEHQAKQAQPQGHFVWMGHIGSVLFLTLYYFCMNVTSYGLSTFMPKIVKSILSVSDDMATTIAAVAYIMGLIGMLVNGWHSDKTRERIWHVATPLVLLSGGIYLTAFLIDYSAILAMIVLLVVVGACMYAHLPAYWPIPSTFLGGAVAASAVGFINMIGNLGGGVGPVLVGSAAEKSYQLALYYLAPFPLVSAAVIIGIGFYIRYRQRQALVVSAPPPVEKVV